MRLIDEGVLTEFGEEFLAERLGIGSRHLRRLFLQHLGATPIAVAQTRRLHFAKKLIDETSLSMSYVALASGFGCVRRFNGAIRKTYHRTPSQIRNIARQKSVLPEGQYLFHLCFRPPYDWRNMLAFLAARATPGVESVELGTYCRSISLNGNDGHFEVSFDEENNSLVARVQFANPRSLFFITERIRAMFDLNANWQTIATKLRTDPVLRGRIKSVPGLRVPGCWNGFELATRAILGQQISVQGATTLAGRMVRAFGRPFRAASNLSYLFPGPEALADARVASIGLPRARAETIQAFARAVCDGEINFEGFVDVDSFLTRLCEIPGIGKWTAQYVAMRALGDPDAFPSGDLGLQRSMSLTTPCQLERRAEAWRPWRAYAAMYLWQIKEPAPYAASV